MLFMNLIFVIFETYYISNLNPTQMKMKFKLLFTGLLSISSLAFGKQIDENTAKMVGQAFLQNSTNSPALKSTVSLKTAYRSGSKTTGPLTSLQASTYFYVFNTDSKGYVIVAGDDNVLPILGYSDEINFDPDNIPENVAKWLEGYKSQIRSIIENHTPATAEISGAWEKLKNGSGYPVKASEKAVGPLVQTKWNQAPYYNDLCPYDNGAGEHAVTGCVATAMAQIMKYWNYPASGSGFHSYNDANYGTLSANFGTTSYEWASMPNTLSGSNSAIATLMYQVGVSVDMNYGTGATGGSSAYVISSLSPVTNCSEYALKSYFGYKNTLQGIVRENYNSSQWLNTLEAEFDAGRPVLYAGFGSGGGHCFVADGYDNNNYVHFNWGWGGAYDGYFEINSLNPDGLGIGGGTGSYNSRQQAVIGIEPPNNVQSYDISLYNYVTPSSNPITYTHSFTIATNVANFGSGTFTGDFAAAIFDNAYNFLDFIETKTDQTLQAGYAYINDLVFSSSGLVSMLPGTYYAGIFYRPAGGDWIQVSNNNDYTNLVQLQVTYANDIELYSDIAVTPGNTLMQGEAASVNLNVINNGTTTFTGQYIVALYDLEGKPVQSFDAVNETDGLPQGYTYLAPFLTFNCSSITADPGTYLLAVSHKYTGGNWQLTGSTNYQNPVKVIVQTAVIQPDSYEDNNTVGESRDLPVNLSNNTAHITTPGTNCHTGNDYDYFKIDLPEGYDYSISARLQDSYSSNDGNTYSLDALFSFSADGTTWSDTYDDVMDGNIIKNGGGTVYFMVSPYFTGETGTYLLDMNVSRSPSTSVKDNELADLIRVYPNPAHDMIWIDLSAFHGGVDQIELVNAEGQQVISPVEDPLGKTIKVSVENLPGGLYFLKLHTDKGIITKKTIIKD
jgi:hypothetical protein